MTAAVIGALLGAQTSKKKAEAARRNGAKGGRPRKPKRVARRSNNEVIERRPLTQTETPAMPRPSLH